MQIIILLLSSKTGQMEGSFFDKPFDPTGGIDIDSAYGLIFSMFSNLEPSLPDDFFKRFRQITKPASFKCDEIIVDYGEVCKYAYLMISGLVRLSRILKDRGETTVTYLGAGDILISPHSFYTQTVSKVKLTAIADIICIAISWHDLQILYREFLELNIVGRLLTEKYYCQALERLTWLYESPEVRYENMLRDYPSVVEQVSVKELASYLGIAPETLSRIRHRKARKGNASND